MTSSKLMRLAIFLAVFMCARAEFNLTRKVRMFIEKTEELSGWTDVFAIRELKELQEHAEKYLKIGSHIGNFIAAAADVEFEEGSEEQNALYSLHSKFWALINEQQKYVDRIEYLREVEAGYFKYLDRVYRTECPIIAEEDVSRLVRVQEAYRHFENRNRMNTSHAEPWKYKESKKQIMTNIRKFTVQQTDELISNLESTTFSFMQRLFYSVHRNFEDFASSDIFNALRSVKSECIPEMVYHAAEENCEAASAAAQLLKLDLVGINAITAVCANISNGGDENRMKHIFEETHNKTQKIVAHMNTWIEQTYMHTIPRVGIEAAKRYIDNKEFRNETEYAALERKMRFTFQSREPFDKFHYVFVAPTSVNGVWWSMQTVHESGMYTNLTNYNGVDVHVFRYNPDTSYEWRRKATEWMDQNQNEFREILRRNLGKTSAEVMQALNDATNQKLCSPELYHTVFLIGGISEKFSDLLMGKTKSFFSRPPATESVEVSVIGRHWKLFFLV